MNEQTEDFELPAPTTLANALVCWREEQQYGCKGPLTIGKPSNAVGDGDNEDARELLRNFCACGSNAWSLHARLTAPTGAAVLVPVEVVTRPMLAGHYGATEPARGVFLFEQSVTEAHASIRLDMNHSGCLTVDFGGEDLGEITLRLYGDGDLFCAGEPYITLYLTPATFDEHKRILTGAG